MFAVRIRGRLLYVQWVVTTGSHWEATGSIGFFILRLFYGAVSAEEFIECLIK